MMDSAVEYSMKSMNELIVKRAFQDYDYLSHRSKAIRFFL